MLIRILLLVVVLTLLSYLASRLLIKPKRNRCNYCDGLGYWKGTRGERNHCKECNGTGTQLPRH